MKTKTLISVFLFSIFQFTVCYANGGEKSEKGPDYIGAVIMLVILIYCVFFYNRCPNCKKRHALKQIKKTYRSCEYDSNGHRKNIYNVTKRCKYCGFQVTDIEKGI